jgi:c-di-GMP-binding flagellar brake protein YcgR
MLKHKDPGSDKRKFKRVPVGFDLLYKIEGEPEVHLKYGKCVRMFDLSEGGMAIWTDTPLTISTELDITFHVIFKDYQTPPMDAKGRVAYCVPIPGKNMYRLGIRFTRILPEAQQEINRLIKTKTVS